MRPPLSRRTLTASQQLIFLRNAGFEGAECRLKRNKLIWRGELRPDALGRSYAIRIECAPPSYPDVFVEQPNLLALSNGREPPHIYHDPMRLCLHLPDAGEWEPWMRIDQTIIPWTMLWLYYFEEWLESDDWKGRGEHPNSPNEPSGTRLERRRRTSLARTQGSR